MVAKNGLTKEIIREICDGATTSAQGSSLAVYYSKRFGGFVTDQWNSVSDLIERYGNQTAQWALKVMDGEEDGFEFYEMADESAREFLKDLSPNGKNGGAQSYKEAWDYLRLNIGLRKIAEIMELVEEGIGNREIYDESEVLAQPLIEIIDALKESGEDETLWDAAVRAADTGLRYGAEQDMSDDFMRALNNPDDKIPGTLVTFKKDGWWHDRNKRDDQGKIVKAMPHIFHVLSVIEILDAIAEGINNEDFISPWLAYERSSREKRNWINLDEPQYGWSGWDLSAANETFQSEIPPPPKPEPKPRRRGQQQPPTA